MNALDRLEAVAREADELPVLARSCPVCGLIYAEHDGMEGVALCMETMTSPT